MNMKKDRIFKTIKQSIISGQYKEGDKLPTEFECMEIYGVSRDTIRNAFKMLESEGFLKRVKSKGTFVQLPDIPSEKRTIYFLVPCYEYLHYCSDHFQHIMFDLIAECALAGWNFVPVIFSQTNNNEDIWWANLSRFNSDSKIVITHYWFATYFKTLASIDAKVAFINNGSAMDEEMTDFSNKWAQFIELDSYAGEQSVKYLAEKKCRKIALVMSYIDTQYNSLLGGYNKMIKHLGLSACTMGTTEDTGISDLQNFYNEQKFDGLIIHVNEYKLPRKETLREALGLPENMPIVAVPNKSSSFFADRRENIAVAEYPIRPMAHDIVEYLISPQKKNKKFRYYPEIINY